MRKFDKETLARYNGEEGVYVAHNGRVYDVSGSKLWETGEHMKRHLAGADLSVELQSAPHGPEMLERFPQVGIMETVEEKGAEKHLPDWLTRLFRRWPMLERHPHPMLVHFPIVFFSSAPVFTLLSLLTGNPAFDTTALNCLGAGLLMTPFTIATGFFTWWLNYMAQPIRAVRIKIWTSVWLVLAAVAAFLWRFSTPNILTTPGVARAAYVLLICCLLPLVVAIGWFGASITFPVKKD